MLIFALRKELFEKHEEYSVTKQVSNFLSIAHSHASSSPDFVTLFLVKIQVSDKQ